MQCLNPKSATMRPGCQVHSSRSRVAVVPKALFGRKAPVKAKEPEEEEEEKKPAKRKESVISQTINAFDFAVPRSKKDADLLYEAKYGKREGGKMTPEQYAALRRKVGGTAKDYFKEYVEEDRVENTYYKPGQSGGTVPFLPLLVGILVAVLGATVVVVGQTGGVH